LPTLEIGDRIVQFPHATWLRSPKRGDLVTFPVPPNSDGIEGNYTKRVIGLPGEQLSVVGNNVFVDGRVLEEPYVTRGWQQPTPIRRFVIPDGEYFVMGDNRDESGDSRWFGTIPRDDLILTIPKDGGTIGGIAAADILDMQGWVLFLWPFACAVAAFEIERRNRRRSMFWVLAFIGQGVGLAIVLLLPNNRGAEVDDEDLSQAA